MKKTLILLTFVPFLLLSQNKITVFESEEFDHLLFKPSEKVYVFGNNVRLRSKPNINSKVLENISISKEVTILETTNEFRTYNNIRWIWYKVKYNNISGYVLGGLLSRKTLVNNKKESKYLTSFRKKDRNNYFLIIRNLNKGHLIEYELPFEDPIEIYFDMRIYFDSLISEVTEVVYIDYVATAEGVKDGGLYLFNDGKKLIKAIETIDKGGENEHYVEKVILPMEEEGDGNGLIIVKTNHTRFENKNPVLPYYVSELKESETFTFEWKGIEINISETRIKYN